MPVLQVACGQKVSSLTACLANQSLRLDCRHENTTTLPILYEFSLTRETKKHVLSGNIGVVEHAYRARANVSSKYNIKVLYLQGFTTKDEGTYTCELRLSGQPGVASNMNISVYRGERPHPPPPPYSPFPSQAAVEPPPCGGAWGRAQVTEQGPA